MASKRNVPLSILTRIIVSVVLLAVAVGLFVVLFVMREKPGRVTDADARPRVRVIEAMAVPVARQWDGYGTARPRFAAAVPAQVRGVVASIPPEIVAGVSVTRGQVLVQIDSADYVHEIEMIQQRVAEIQSQVAQLDIERDRMMEQLELLQDEVELAQADLDRLLAAREAVGATQREVDQVRGALNAAKRAEVAARDQLERIPLRRAQLDAVRAQQEAALRLAERNLERTTVVSPMDGVLQSVDVEEGEAVQIDQRVARVVNLARIEVPLQLPAASRPAMSVGADVVLTTTGFLRREWTAAIARIAPEDDERTRTVTVYVELQQSLDAAHRAAMLSPGQFVRGSVTERVPQRRWVVPRRAIQADRIRTIDGDGVVDSRRVRVAFHVQQEFPEFGLHDTHWAVLADPLEEGTLVVVDGGRILPEGTLAQPVRITTEITEKGGVSAFGYWLLAFGLLLLVAANSQQPKQVFGVRCSVLEDQQLKANSQKPTAERES